VSGPLAALVGRYRNDRLARSSVHLMVNNVVATGLGFVAWIVTTRLWASSEVGDAAAAISAAGLAASLAMLGVQGTLLRFVPSSTDARGLLGTAIAVTAPVAVVLGLCFGIWQSGGLSGGHSRVAALALFVALVVALVLKSVVEAAVVAIRATGAVIAANASGNAAKIASVAVLGALSTGPLGIVVGTLVAATTALVMLVRAAQVGDILAGPQHASVAVVRSLHRYSLTFYFNGLIGGIPALALPILVRERLGSDAAAYWYIASLMALALFQLPAAVGTALLVEGSHRRGELLRLVLSAARGLALVMVPVIVIAVIAAPWVLHLFGATYVDQSTSPFRIMAVSGLLVSASYLLGDVLFVRRRLGPLVALNVVNAVVVIGLAARATSLDGVAWAWLVGEVANVAMFAVLIPLFPERGKLPEEVTR